MAEPSLSAKVGVLIGFLVALCAFLWLLMMSAPQQELERLGFLSALFCAEAVFTFCWAAVFAYVARKWNWPARSCNLVGLPFVITGFCVSWLFLASGRWPIGGVLICMGLFATMIARKLAYPRVAPEEMYSSEPPLSLLQK